MKTGKFFSIAIILYFTYVLSGCAPDSVDAYGHPIRISNYRGKWVVINYWATWCTSCVSEIPALNDLAKYYQDKVVVLGVNVDDLSNQTLRNLGRDYRVKYPFLRS